MILLFRDGSEHPIEFIEYDPLPLAEWYLLPFPDHPVRLAICIDVPQVPVKEMLDPDGPSRGTGRCCGLGLFSSDVRQCLCAWAIEVLNDNELLRRAAFDRVFQHTIGRRFFFAGARGKDCDRCYTQQPETPACDPLKPHRP